MLEAVSKVGTWVVHLEVAEAEHLVGEVAGSALARKAERLVAVALSVEAEANSSRFCANQSTRWHHSSLLPLASVPGARSRCSGHCSRCMSVTSGP